MAKWTGVHHAFLRASLEKLLSQLPPFLMAEENWYGTNRKTNVGIETVSSGAREAVTRRGCFGVRLHRFGPRNLGSFFEFGSDRFDG